jgi:Na+/H+-dicarboxylate symporter
MTHKVSLPVQLLIILATVFIFGNLFNIEIIRLFFTISLFFKECLQFLLPFIIFSFISSGILAFKKNAPAVLAILLSCIVLSNALVAFFSYFTGTALFSLIIEPGTSLGNITSSAIQPFFTFALPHFIRSELALLAAVITGMFLSFVDLPQMNSSIISLKKMVETVITRLFIPILPLYIFGFLLSIQHQGIFGQLFASYGKTFGLIACLQLVVLFTLYSIASHFSLTTTLLYIKNALPSYITAFGTMSSTATIPVTAQCAEKNGVEAPLALMATPILANVHLLGDAITTPILALVTLYLFTGEIPTIAAYATFVGYFCLNMLAASGIPGGGIIVMIPILISLLGFNDEMISIITTLYLLQDGLGTAGNVMGDGALMIIINKILRRLQLDS